MKEYHKITSVFKRDPATKHKTLLMGEWGKPEFGYLADCEWVYTEKVDGTNIRVLWDGEKVRFSGRTDAAQLYAPLIERLQEKFYAGAMNEVFHDMPVCLYGEGYGAKIQKAGGNYISDGVDFVLFDVLVNDNWLERTNIVDIANKLQIDIVPIIGSGTLHEAVEKVQHGFWSTWGAFEAEGIVARPAVEMRDRMGSRIITKIKCRDFA